MGALPRLISRYDQGRHHLLRVVVGVVVVVVVVATPYQTPRSVSSTTTMSASATTLSSTRHVTVSYLEVQPRASTTNRSGGGSFDC